ncbi:Uncharacterised protein [Mycolicibacterium flavescens]|uniref:hypothetical protein n=1 Tax=Mycobacterium neumannii TaxID=2048551 RepID=UPI000B93E197|nr:hypothetical protein [Mycobacterium neumannii]VEG40469.1 Uncharacterised protein [Mycolicibacterium flavescens]
MSDQNPFRAEIEQILRTHTRTRYAKVFLGMERGLTDDEMAEESVLDREPVQPSRIAKIRETVRMTLDDELASNKTRADNQAGLYDELRHYQMSTELRQHLNTCFAQLQQMYPSIRSRPMEHIRLGASDQSSRRKPERKCDKCFEVHAGECL